MGIKLANVQLGPILEKDCAIHLEPLIRFPFISISHNYKSKINNIIYYVSRC